MRTLEYFPIMATNWLAERSTSFAFGASLIGGFILACWIARLLP